LVIVSAVPQAANATIVPENPQRKTAKGYERSETSPVRALPNDAERLKRGIEREAGAELAGRAEE
jgi:hypothetical protein